MQLADAIDVFNHTLLLCSLDLCLFEILLELLDAEFQLKLLPLGSLISELSRLAKLLNVYDRAALNLGNLVAKVVNINYKSLF